MKPVVSVILPFYNAAGTLDRAVRSIAGQQLDAFECLLVNNNSTDSSREIAREWTRRDSRFRLVDEPRQGVMFAFNAGAEHARGRYLARMDADDVSYPDRLRRQVAFLEEHPGYGAVCGTVRYVSHSEKETRGFARYVRWVNSVRTYREILHRRFIESPVVNPSALWRREVGEKLGLYRSGDFPEDYEMWLRWLDQGVKIHKLDPPVMEWHDSEHRLTRTHAIYSDAAFYRIKTRYLARWLEEHNPFHPEVAIWGASRISRRRAQRLTPYGIRFRCYIDTRRGRQLDHELLYYKDLPRAGKLFILTYIKQMDAREETRDYLESLGYEEGKNYLMVS